MLLLEISIHFSISIGYLYISYYFIELWIFLGHIIDQSRSYKIVVIELALLNLAIVLDSFSLPVELIVPEWAYFHFSVRVSDLTLAIKHILLKSSLSYNSARVDYSRLTME